MTQWEFIDEGLSGDTMALWRSKQSGDMVEVKDTYSNPVSNAIARTERFEVTYESPHMGRRNDLSDDFGNYLEAFDYATDVMGENLEDWLEELGYNEK